MSKMYKIDDYNLMSCGKILVPLNEIISVNTFAWVEGYGIKYTLLIFFIATKNFPLPWTTLSKPFESMLLNPEILFKNLILVKIVLVCICHIPLLLNTYSYVSIEFNAIATL